MFRVQSNVIVTRLRQRSLHSAQNLKRYFEARIFSPLQTLCHRPATRFSGRPAPAAQFIDTHLHVASRNQGSVLETRERTLGCPGSSKGLQCRRADCFDAVDGANPYQNNE